MRVRTILRGAIGVAGFVLVMEVLGRTGVIDPYTVPLASDVLAKTVVLAGDAAFLAKVGDTLSAAVIGLLLAIVIAVPAGVVLGTLPRVETAVRPLVEFLRPIPSVALIPLALFVFTGGAQAEIALIVFTSSWPLLINTWYGVRDVDPLAKETMRSFGFGPAAIVARVLLPSAAPFILTGVRIAASVTLIVAVSVELVAGGDSGIGTFLTDQGTAGVNRRDVMLAAVTWTGMIGLLVNIALVAAERRLFRRHHARAGQEAA
ncbi:ABC transporter permease [Sphaerimonospora cavernae]|uniref:ABC transporter permease n=1 Tax=Sphaerimonospora cavernae TaxID=1740611 RepID=A0ABV6UCG0_9ACTN